MYRKVFSSFVKNHGVTALKDDLSNLEHLSTSLAAELFKDPRLHNTYGTCETLARHATHFFLENDLFTSVHKFMEKAHGSSLSIRAGTSSTISFKLLVS